MAEYKEVFMLFDKDEDGVLSFPELSVVMKSLGQRPSGKIYSQTTIFTLCESPEIYDGKIGLQFFDMWC